MKHNPSIKEQLQEMLAKRLLAKGDSIPWDMQVQEKRDTYLQMVEPETEAILKIIESEVIGEDEGYGDRPYDDKSIWAGNRNSLRESQRERLR